MDANMSLDDQISQRREELGRELWASIRLSEESREITIASVQQHPDPRGVSWRQGETSATFVRELNRLTLPFDTPVHAIGRHAKAALVEMSLEELDPFDESRRRLEEARRGYLYFQETGTADPKLSFVGIAWTLATEGAHWLTLSRVYEDLDDADLLLQASIRIGCSDAIVGNWILRMHGAYQQLIRSHDAWWSPLAEEVSHPS